MMDTSEVKRFLGGVVADEPPFRPDVERVIARSQRLRQRRVVTRIAVGASAAAILSTIVVGLPREAREQQGTTPALSLLSFATGPDGAPSKTGNHGSSSRSLDSLLPTIKDNSPHGLTFDLSATELAGGELLIDGTVDDRKGAGRLFIAMSSEKGSTTANPCSDDEFHQGASCTTEVLQDGSRLVLRGIADFEGARTLAVVLIRLDGSGIYAESGNWLPSEVAPRPVEEGEEQEDIPPPSVSRAEPVYTTEQLATLIRAIASEV